MRLTGTGNTPKPPSIVRRDRGSLGMGSRKSVDGSDSISRRSSAGRVGAVMANPPDAVGYREQPSLAA